LIADFIKNYKVQSTINGVTSLIKIQKKTELIQKKKFLNKSSLLNKEYDKSLAISDMYLSFKKINKVLTKIKTNYYKKTKKRRILLKWKPLRQWLIALYNKVNLTDKKIFNEISVDLLFLLYGIQFYQKIKKEKTLRFFKPRGFRKEKIK